MTETSPGFFERFRNVPRRFTAAWAMSLSFLIWMIPNLLGNCHKGFFFATSRSYGSDWTSATLCIGLCILAEMALFITFVLMAERGIQISVQKRFAIHAIPALICIGFLLLAWFLSDPQPSAPEIGCYGYRRHGWIEHSWLDYGDFYLGLPNPLVGTVLLSIALFIFSPAAMPLILKRPHALARFFGLAFALIAAFGLGFALLFVFGLLYGDVLAHESVAVFLGILLSIPLFFWILMALIPAVNAEESKAGSARIRFFKRLWLVPKRLTAAFSLIPIFFIWIWLTQKLTFSGGTPSALFFAEPQTFEPQLSASLPRSPMFSLGICILTEMALCIAFARLKERGVQIKTGLRCALHAALPILCAVFACVTFSQNFVPEQDRGGALSLAIARPFFLCFAVVALFSALVLAAVPLIAEGKKALPAFLGWIALLLLSVVLWLILPISADAEGYFSLNLDLAGFAQSAWPLVDAIAIPWCLMALFNPTESLQASDSLKESHD